MTRRRERVIDENRRLVVVWCWYALHLVAIFAVIVGLLVAKGRPSDLGTALGLGLWLGTFATTSVLLLTAGLMGLYEKTSPVVLTKSVAAALAVLTGLPLYGIGLVSTPILIVAGVLLRLAIIGIQRFFGLRLATETPDRGAGQSGSGRAQVTSELPSGAPTKRRISPPRFALMMAATLVLIVGGGLTVGLAIALSDTNDTDQNSNPSLEVSVVSYSVDQSDDPVVMGQTTVNQKVQIKMVNTSSGAITLHPLSDIGIAGAGAGDGVPRTPSFPRRPTTTPGRCAS